MNVLRLNDNEKFKRILIALFVISIILRVLLSLLNFQANDDHFAVIDRIKNERRLPERSECWQCFQPKLYHVVAAVILGNLPVVTKRNEIRVAQLINCVAGIITLFFVLSFLKSENFSYKTRLISFSMISLNPKFIAINSQATNDSFVILFSTAAIYYAYYFFRDYKIKDFIYMTGFTILSALSKGNGIVTFMGVLVIFLLTLIKIKSIALSRKKVHVVCLSIYCLAFLLLALPAGQYLDKYLKYGNPFALNDRFYAKPFPHFFKNTSYEGGRPGVTSIFNSYFTFRFFDLLKNPAVKNHVSYDLEQTDLYYLHQTSLWSQLYGRTHFVFFDSWPPTWRTSNRVILNLGRAILVLALLPTFILIFGIMSRLTFWIRSIIKGRLNFISNTYAWIFDPIIFGYILFIIVYTLIYRDWPTMKAIFLFPALLPAVAIFSKQLDSFYTKFGVKSRVTYTFDRLFGSLVSLYALSIAALIYKLWKQPFY